MSKNKIVMKSGFIDNKIEVKSKVSGEKLDNKYWINYKQNYNRCVLKKVHSHYATTLYTFYMTDCPLQII